MAPIYDDLYQFSFYVPPINLTFHQYLLRSDDPVLVHTGNIHQAEALIPKLQTALSGKRLKYIFISHFEADECGGLSLLLEYFPYAKPICSEITQRQLMGFGITNDIISVKPNDKIASGNYELQFISYPSEMHLWEGLLLMENKRKILFSSDLMFNLGNTNGCITNANWHEEVSKISHEQLPDPGKRNELQKNLLNLTPSFVAVGHGECLQIK